MDSPNGSTGILDLATNSDEVDRWRLFLGLTKRVSVKHVRAGLQMMSSSTQT